MQIKTNLANKLNYGDVRDLSKIKYIVIHYTGNDGDSDDSNANYFKSHIVEASAHYFVDDDSVTQSVPDNYVAWSVGGDKYPSCSTSGGGRWYGKCVNNNSISIELCDSIKNGVYDFTNNTLKQAAELTADLIKKYNIPIENVIRHFDVVGKDCPKPFVSDYSKWTAFIERVKSNMLNVETEAIIINGKSVDMKTITVDGVTYTAMRGLIEAAGGKVEYDSKTKKKTVTI